MRCPQDSALLTDLYQLTMLQGYFEQDMTELAVFEFFVRKFPEHRNFLVAAGLEQVVAFIEQLQFHPDQLEWLRGTGRFSDSFIDSLESFRFTGAVHAMPEGTVFFPNEPIVRITAPLPEAQLVESRVINLLHFQTLIASKAARMAIAAPDKLLVDFGLRRAHGAEAGLLAARAAYLGGLSGTATVLADQMFGVPIYGTMAHSFVQAHDNETAAFEHFATAQPDNVVLLIDTYDTETAAEKLIHLAQTLKTKGIAIKAVRIDSGDLAEHARRVRAILDSGNLQHVRIFASGNLDEYVLQRYVDAKVPIDGYGIGTRLDTSADAPYLDCAYKLQEYRGRARRKRSEGKATWPGRKQVYRHHDSTGTMQADILTLETDIQDGEPLVQPIMKDGKRLSPAADLQQVRSHAFSQLKRLPPALRKLEPAEPYPVSISDALQVLALEVDQQQH